MQNLVDTKYKKNSSAAGVAALGKSSDFVFRMKDTDQDLAIVVETEERTLDETKLRCSWRDSDFERLQVQPSSAFSYDQFLRTSPKRQGAVYCIGDPRFGIDRVEVSFSIGVCPAVCHRHVVSPYADEIIS